MIAAPKLCPACKGKGILSVKRQREVKVSLQDRKSYNATMKKLAAKARADANAVRAPK